MSIEINWDEAPEGATHWHPCHSVFYKSQGDNGWSYWAHSHWAKVGSGFEPAIESLIPMRPPMPTCKPPKPEPSPVNPSHYKSGDVECIDALKAATVNKSGIEAVCVANVIKYLWRYEQKGGLTDVNKARWYLDRLIVELGE